MEKYQRNTQVIDGTIDSRQVIMQVERGKYFGLNPIGKRIWELIEAPKTLEQITSDLLLEYNITPDQCKTEVQAFLEKGVECDIIVRL
jgi:hypothetical protein